MWSLILEMWIVSAKGKNRDGQESQGEHEIFFPNGHDACIDWGGGDLQRLSA